ncbi:MAG TPA: ribosome recycling factor [Chloroflexota bacterium]|jgi:ribosome recycling factor|nr:ribosome recycling factor [Chloroflexota bacterium]
MTQDSLDDIIKGAEHKMTSAIDALGRDLQSIRTGRATPMLLDRVQVDYYGTQTPINGVANISAPDARMVVIQPWDRGMLGVIEKAIQKSDIGINPTNDGSVIRLVLPQLTQDRRKELVKHVHQRAEEARIAVRNCRRDALDHLRKTEKDGGVSQEDERRAQERLQKLTDGFVKKVDEVSRAKETEVLEV